MQKDPTGFYLSAEGGKPERFINKRIVFGYNLALTDMSLFFES